ncbi:hypothetical protein JOM56_009602, partial [Amanita muscaria]
YLIDILHSSSENSQRVVCFLILSTPGPDNTTYDDDVVVPIANPLSTTLALSKLIQDNTDIPISDHKIDLSLSIVPCHYLLSAPFKVPEGHILLSLSQARREGILSPAEDAQFDLRVGQYLGQLHSNVQNEWFGMPQAPTESRVGMLPLPIAFSTPPGGDSAYSWQETFITLFEALLARAGEKQKKKYTLPSKDIHRSLSRAISFFLFDDVQVPSLVMHTGTADDIFITLPIKSKDLGGLPPIEVPVPDSRITYVLPNLTHAVWGDPLLETMFTSPNKAVLEGYVGAGGSKPIVFPRQKTKRLWYTLFSALLVLAEGFETLEEEQEKVDDSGSEKTVRAVLLLRDKFDWKQRVEVEVEEPEELSWDPRVGPQENGTASNGEELEEGSSEEEDS